MDRLAVLCGSLLVACVAQNVSYAVEANGMYQLSVDGELWYTSTPPELWSVCVAGVQVPLSLQGSNAATSGNDAFGAWTGTTLSLDANGTEVTWSFKAYAAQPSLLVATAAFPAGMDTSGCGGGGPSTISSAFPSWDCGSALAPTLGTMSWTSTALTNTPTAQGLAALGQNTMDSGPVVSFMQPASGQPGNTALVWSTLDSHKIITQTTRAPPPPPSLANISALWSSTRTDQLACLSPVCFADQANGGAYLAQRVEGYAFTAVGSTVCIGGTPYDTLPLKFAWSGSASDNWVGTNASEPDASYSFIGQNGFVLAKQAPGSVPLIAYSRVYDAVHTDWAAVASSAGQAWALSTGYTPQYVTGYVFSSPISNFTCDREAAGTGGVYSMGPSAVIPSIPAAWSYSIVFHASSDGPTGATYAWGAAMQFYSNTSRMPSVTLTDIGYYTDDGAYYYVWEAFNIPARPWAAEEGLQLVVANLTARGVPVAYLQLDDWWYQGPFYFGNVKSVVNWTASPVDRLFPHGLPAFSDALALPLQLYVPFWADAFQTTYNMTESTAFKGTKLVTPDDSYAFFCDWFDNGLSQTNGRFKAFEIDFLDSNFIGSASMFSDVTAAYRWYKGMADAAQERGVVIQYCLPSVTDMLMSLSFPSVVQARASADYVNTVSNAATIGGSALLMGAVAIAPSKDTLWTASPQPPTYSDTMEKGDYTTQPHVILDCVLATLSLGPVGISDGIGQTDVDLISQAFRSANDSTLLRPTRPVSWVDSYFYNTTWQGSVSDVRSTHAAIPRAPDSSDNGTFVSHYVLAWRTSEDVTLGPTDLYPSPAPTTVLAIRGHIFAPAGAGQQAGCTDAVSAVPTCIQLTNAGTGAVIQATGTDLPDLSLTALYEPLPNGAYFLGELSKFVHVAPQRFDYVGLDSGLDALGQAQGQGPCGLRVGVRGSSGEAITLTAVDPQGITRVTVANVPSTGFVEVHM